MAKYPGNSPRKHAGKGGGKGSFARPRQEEAPLYGINPVLSALQAGKRKPNRLYLKSGKLSEKLELLGKTARELGIPVDSVLPQELEALCASPQHQGVVYRCGPLPLLPENDALAFTEQPDAVQPGAVPPLLVALDQVEDPQNLGAVVRSCAAFGANGVVMTRRHGAPTSAATSKASAGALETFPLYEAANMARFLENAKLKGFWVAGAVISGGQPLYRFKRDQPLVLVLGNEGRGIRPLVEKLCDYQLTIPITGRDSLNVSAAAAVLLYQLTVPTDQTN